MSTLSIKEFIDKYDGEKDIDRMMSRDFLSWVCDCFNRLDGKNQAELKIRLAKTYINVGWSEYIQGNVNECNELMREGARLAEEMLSLAIKERNGTYIGFIYNIRAQYTHCHVSFVDRAHATPKLVRGLALSLRYESDPVKNIYAYHALSIVAYTLSRLNGEEKTMLAIICRHRLSYTFLDAKELMFKVVDHEDNKRHPLYRSALIWMAKISLYLEDYDTATMYAEEAAKLPMRDTNDILLDKSLQRILANDMSIKGQRILLQ